MCYKEKVQRRLEHIKTGTLQGIEVRAIIEYVDKNIGMIEKFIVSSIENAEEDICEIISEDNEYIQEDIRNGFTESGGIRKLIKVLGE